MKKITINELRELSGGEVTPGGVIGWVINALFGETPEPDEPAVGDCFNQGDNHE